MMSRFTLSPRGQRDLDAIWNHTLEHWGIHQAEFYVRQIGKSIDVVAHQPDLGQLCPQVREDYYKYPSGSHFLFYRLTDSGIDIVRILHKRMDFEQHV